MPLRALRLLSTRVSPETAHVTSLSFADTLQLAAGRAWSRRVNTHSTTNTPPKKRATRGDTHPKRSTTPPPSPGPSSLKPSGSISDAGRKKWDIGAQSLGRSSGQDNNLTNIRLIRPLGNTKRRNIVFFDPEAEDYKVNQRDPPQESRDNPVYQDIFDIVPANVMPYVLTQVTESDSCLGKSAAIPAPTSQRSLRRNLLFFLQRRNPPLSLPSIIDYHNLYPQWHSTRSSNLLIHLGLRNRSFGLVRRLMASFRENGLQRNTETYQLEIRWLILQGKWDEAWTYANRVKTEISQDGNLPLPIWLEFCRPRHVPQRNQTTLDDDENVTANTQKHNADSTLFRSRHEMLRRYLPPSMPSLPRSSPFVIRCIVQLLIKSEHRDAARELAQNYFKAVPSQLNPRRAAGCMNIIHALMMSTPSKNGLPRFYESRKTLISLLKLNSSLQPTPRTLYILLKPLFRAKRCGTIAWETLRNSKSQWGKRVESRPVLRRVSQLALKEGRFDVVDKIAKIEELDRLSRQRQLEERKGTDTLEISSINPSFRPRLPHIYTGNGREARRWFRHRLRVRTKLRNRLYRGINQTRPLRPE